MSNVSPNGTFWNPHGWNNEANLLFLDQPYATSFFLVPNFCLHPFLRIAASATGFSFSEFGNTVETSQGAAKDIVAFFNVFFSTFQHLKGAGVHLAGESYAVSFRRVRERGRSNQWQRRAISFQIFASEILDHNTVAQSEGRDEINLKSIVIANGITDIMT